MRRGDASAVLKLVNPGNEEERAPLALRHWNGAGAVRVLELDGRAVLLERALPGTPLADVSAAGRDGEATAILADAMARLSRPDAPAAPLGGWPTLQGWGDGFRRQRERGTHRLIDAALVDRGESLWRALCDDTAAQFFLHGDLHHDNVLLDANRGWLAIDPKGVIGDAAYEPANAIRNPGTLPDLVADPATMARRAAIFAERLGFDRQRILSWFFAQIVLSVCWLVEDGMDEAFVRRGIHLAEIAGPLAD